MIRFAIFQHSAFLSTISEECERGIGHGTGRAELALLDPQELPRVARLALSGSPAPPSFVALRGGAGLRERDLPKHPGQRGRADAEKPTIALMGHPFVHFEINSSGAPELVRFYADAFGWNVQQDGHDYADIRTEGVCAGSGEPGIDGGIGTAEPGDDFVTIYVQVPDVQEALENVLALGGSVEMPATEAGRVVMAIFRDPVGNRIGLVRAEPLASA